MYNEEQRVQNVLGTAAGLRNCMMKLSRAWIVVVAQLALF